MDEMNFANPSGRDSSPNDQAFHLLCIRYLDGVHSAADATSLAEQLSASSEKRDTFAALSVEVGLLSEMSLALRQDHAKANAKLGQAINPPSSKSVFDGLGNPPEVLGRTGLRMHWPMQLLVASALLAGGLAGWWLRPRLEDQAGVPIAQPVQVTPVAYLITDTGCAWEDGSLQLKAIGSSVRPGDEISLQEGIAEFRLANGVYLSLEGPAGLVMTSPTSLALQYGKATAHVPWSVADFNMIAGTCRFRAANAEFGISVTGGRVDAHVFSGELWAGDASLIEQFPDRSQEVSKNGEVFKTAVIPSGRLLRLKSQDGTLRMAGWAKAVPSQFATRLSMSGILPVSQGYREAVLASHPVAYWRFEEEKGGIVSSELPEGGDLRIVGDLRLSGSKTNRVAELRPGSDCYLVSQKSLDVLARTDYSMEVWLKPSHAHRGGILGLCASDPITGREQSAFLLELENSNAPLARESSNISHSCQIRFLHRDPPSRSAQDGTSCYSSLPYRIRRWQHVVAVKRGDQMELYVDGKQSTKALDASSLAAGLRLIVGRQETKGSVVQFIGQLDEIAVYLRALTAEEIATHYKAVTWDQVRSSVRAQPDT